MEPAFRFPLMRIFHVYIMPHDLLWFASFDSGAVSVTEPAIHNYALCYAFSRFERSWVELAQPQYETDLEEMNWYAHPAQVIKTNRIRLTWNAIDNRTQTTEDPDFQKANTPKIGSKVVLAPFPATVMETYVFSKQGECPPRVIRLGKKRTPCQVQWREVFFLTPLISSKVQSGHLINPLDVDGQITEYRIVSVPPSLLASNAVVNKAVIIRDEDRNVIIPKRLLAG